MKSNINFNPNSRNTSNACPCYVHTFETGGFSWGFYTNKATEPATSSKVLDNCHYLEKKTNAGVSWHVEKSNNNYFLESSNTKFVGELAATAKDEWIWIAPGLLFNNTSETDTYTITITLETLGDPASGHKAELWSATRDFNKKHPTSDTGAALISESDFATKVAAAMVSAGHTAYGSLSSNEFSTNGKTITISATFTTTIDQIRYLGIRDLSPSPDSNYAKFRIHGIHVEPAGYFEAIPLSFPQFKATVTPIKNNTRGKIEFDNTAEAVKCLWCWGDGTIMEKIPPTREKLGRGWHYLKGINLTEGYTLPVQRFYMRQTKSASPTVSWPPYSMQSLINKYNLLYNNWTGGTIGRSSGGGLGCASDTMKAHVLDYLYKKMYPEEEPVFGVYVNTAFIPYLFVANQPGVGVDGQDSVITLSSAALLADVDIPGVSRHMYLGRGPNDSSSTTMNIDGNGLGVYPVSLGDCLECSDSTLPYQTISGSLITQLGSASTVISPLAGILPTPQTSTDIVTAGGGGGFFTQNINIFIQDGVAVESEPWWNPGDTNQDGVIGLPDLFSVLDFFGQTADWYGDPQGMPAPSSLPWNGGQSGSVVSGGRCCQGEQDFAYPAITLHKNKLWELKNERSNGKTEPGTFLGRGDWKQLNIKSFRGKKENILKRLENKRKKSIFELEDKYAVLYSGSGSATQGRAITSSMIELENLDILRPEFNKSKSIT